MKRRIVSVVVGLAVGMVCGWTGAARAECEPQWLPGERVTDAGDRIFAMTTWDPDGAGPEPVRRWMPPAEPDVPPYISGHYPTDVDGDLLDDGLQARRDDALFRLHAAVSAEERLRAASDLAEMVNVEFIFFRQITQDQIDAFLQLGGEITYIYRAVSYGWNGRVSLAQVRAAADAMGPTLAFVARDMQGEHGMLRATQRGRVRPVWAPGFAGNPLGFDGDASITICVLDTGIDPTHADLAGRGVFAQDFTRTSPPYDPNDYHGHGSAVAAVALGTGAAGGVAGNLRYTIAGDLTNVGPGSWQSRPVYMPAGQAKWSVTALFQGGGSTAIQLASRTIPSGAWVVRGLSEAGPPPLSANFSTYDEVSHHHASGLLSTGGSVTKYALATTVEPYSASPDSFHRFRGIAPECKWANAKVLGDNGSGWGSDINQGIDAIVAQRITLNAKVMNLSLNTFNVVWTPVRDKVISAVNNGVFVVTIAGNLTEVIHDPGRASLALTLGATNDENRVTDYTSYGFANPGSTEDYKPDLCAPGGSSQSSLLLSADSNLADGPAGEFADLQLDDYRAWSGTSFAGPFAAGCAALVIDAMQQNGYVWDFQSSQHPLLVKMVLCATATETNAPREDGNLNPTLQRGAPGPLGFPVSKDPYEGYGMINVDAAIAAIACVVPVGHVESDELGPTVHDRRAWARRVNVGAGEQIRLRLSVSGDGDFDLYLYSASPSPKGTPVTLAFSDNAGLGVDEQIDYVSAVSQSLIVVVKRVEGFGPFTLQVFGATGACCFGNGMCDELTEAECLVAGGEWQGMGTVCEPNPCPQADGACCFANGTCDELTEDDCLVAGGQWQGMGTACDPNRCISPGDMNCDGVVNFADISPFIAALKAGGPDNWPGDCPYLNGDTNGDGLVNFADISGFIALIKAGS